jgi:hypothetical protein
MGLGVTGLTVLHGMYESPGVCVHSSGLTCHPRKAPRTVQHQVVLYATNGTQVRFLGG